MNKKLYFEDVNSISDIIDLLTNDGDNIDYVYSYMIDEKIIEKYMNSLSSLAGSDKEDDFVDLVHFIDKKMNFAGQSKQNRFQKIPTILSCANLYKNYSEQFEEYDTPEKLVVGRYCYDGNLYDWESLSINFPKILMDTITKKYDDYHAQLDYMMYCDFYKGKMSVEELIDFFKFNDIDFIRKKNYEARDKIIEKLGREHESRRF